MKSVTYAIVALLIRLEVYHSMNLHNSDYSSVDVNNHI